MVSETFFYCVHFVSLLDVTIHVAIRECGGLFPSVDVTCPPSIHFACIWDYGDCFHPWMLTVPLGTLSPRVSLM